MSAPIMNRYDLVYFFDVRDGNPNGDPDAGNYPRTDPETGHGLTSNVCLKRKVRDYVAAAREGETGYEIYQTNGCILNNQHQRAYDALGIKAKPLKLPSEAEQAAAITRWMTETFFDIRAFGAVMTTEVHAGHVRGPIQIDFARSIEPISPIEISMTRASVTNANDAEKERTMGSKYIVPYGLYRVHAYINAPMAAKSGFSEQDLELFLTALRDMFDFDRSATRGEMTARELFLFKHDSKLGNAQAHRLFDRIRIKRRNGSELLEIGSDAIDALPPARSYADYAVEVDAEDMPSGVTLQRLWT